MTPPSQRRLSGLLQGRGKTNGLRSLCAAEHCRSVFLPSHTVSSSPGVPPPTTSSLSAASRLGFLAQSDNTPADFSSSQGLGHFACWGAEQDVQKRICLDVKSQVP